MADKRADGIVVSSFSVPRDLRDFAAAKAAREGRSLTDVIREALRRYVGA